MFFFFFFEHSFWCIILKEPRQKFRIISGRWRTSSELVRQNWCRWFVEDGALGSECRLLSNWYALSLSLREVAERRLDGQTRAQADAEKSASLAHTDSGSSAAGGHVTHSEACCLATTESRSSESWPWCLTSGNWYLIVKASCRKSLTTVSTV